MLHKLIDTAIHEFRLPVFHPERCVHSLCETALCHDCVDVCPQGAWVLDEEQLGIIPERCDGCGLCAPACSEAAIETELDVITGNYKHVKISLMACSQALTKSSGKGLVPCLHAMGLSNLLSYYRQGCRSLFFLHGDCDQCPRGNGPRIEDSISRLNTLLQQREMPAITYLRLSKTNWLSIRKALSQTDEKPVTRRNFLRKAITDLVVRDHDNADENNNSLKYQISPGELLPARNENDQHFCYPVFSPDRCNACHACVQLCPHRAIELNEGKKQGYTIYPELCTGCRVCMDVCDQAAIRVVYWATPESRHMPLVKKSCQNCGLSYFKPYNNDFSQDSQKCKVCASANHISNLHQTIES